MHGPEQEVPNALMILQVKGPGVHYSGSYAAGRGRGGKGKCWGPESLSPLSSSSKSCVNGLIGSLWAEWLKDQVPGNGRVGEAAVQEFSLLTELMQQPQVRTLAEE